MSKKIGKVIKFHFHPKEFDKGGHTIEKADNEGRKRRYLCGISSGIKIDSHGERMTEKCIKSFMDQANSGDILLFPDIHGIKESEDIGMLAHAEILPDNNWYTEYGLYDEQDGIGPVKAEKINTLWKQINGFPPYRKARQKGFSIEGIIPEEAIIMDSWGGLDRSVIDDITLDGSVLVPRPAYQDSIATAIYKALGETTPYRAKSIVESLRSKVVEQEVEDNYYKLKWDYQNALEELLDKIMKKSNNNKAEELGILFDEYKDLMINLVMSSEKMFVDEQTDLEESISIGISKEQSQSFLTVEKKSTNVKLELYKSLYSQLHQFNKLLEARKYE